MTAIETFMPGIRTGNFAPCRAGGFAGNHLIHSSFIPAKSVSSIRMTVALTTRSREVPAALRMADTFSKHCRVCSWIVSPTIFPVDGWCGPVPETNTSPAARTAWLYVGGGVGALDVRMMSLAINFSDAGGWLTSSHISAFKKSNCGQKEKARCVSNVPLFYPGDDLLSHALIAHSTIGPAGLNFRVRDGNGCFPCGKITGNLRRLRGV